MFLKSISLTNILNSPRIVQLSELYYSFFVTALNSHSWLIIKAKTVNLESVVIYVNEVRII